MCQLTYCNTGSDSLNQKIYLIAAAIGADIHKHGWGFLGTENTEWDKCSIAANLTLNLGEYVNKASGPLMGHIRLASPQVPVVDKNAHPFTNKTQTIFQFHNGTLSPKDTEKFVTMENVTEKDATTGISITKAVKISDSKIFFEYFLSLLELNKGDFVKSLQDAMKEFYGKFALMYYLSDTKTRYIVRGKTADLYISYLLDSDKEKAKPIGYVVNTSDDVLESSLILTSNLLQLDGKKPLYFTRAEKLKEETIYLAETLGLKEVGIIQENVFVTKYKAYSRDDSFGDYDDKFFSGNLRNPINYAPDKIVTVARYIQDFMDSYSLCWLEIQYLFFAAYGFALHEGTIVVYEHFTKRVLEGLKNKTNASIRKQIRSACKQTSVPVALYSKYKFPWMLNTKQEQLEIAKETRKYYNKR